MDGSHSECEDLTMCAENLLTVAQAAARLAVSPRTVGRMYRTGELPHVRIRGQVRIKSSDVVTYIENHYYTEPV